MVAVIEGLGDAKATAGDKIFSVLFGVLAPAVAFAVSRGVKAEFKKAAERKRPERCLVRFDTYCWGTCGLAFTIFAILAWFNPEKPTVLDKAFSSLMCAVYGPAMAFVGYKFGRYLLRTVWGVDNEAARPGLARLRPEPEVRGAGAAAGEKGSLPVGDNILKERGKCSGVRIL